MARKARQKGLFIAGQERLAGIGNTPAPQPEAGPGTEAVSGTEPDVKIPDLARAAKKTDAPSGAESPGPALRLPDADLIPPDPQSAPEPELQPDPAPLDATGVVLTKNGELWLEKTLDSLSFCNEILVVDSGSTDRTLDIAREAGARVLHRDWEGTIPQFKFAFEHVKTAWVCTIDQDEWLTPELSGEIVQALHFPGEARGFFCPRRSWYFDRYINHGGWYPDHLLRVFRLDSVEIAGTLPHEEFRPAGPTRTLVSDIMHHPYRDLSEHLGKIDAYTRTAAEQLHAKGKKSGPVRALAHAAGKFAKTYFIKKGFLDGAAGLILGVHSFLYAFHKYLRLAELNRRDREAGAAKSESDDKPGEN